MLGRAALDEAVLAALGLDGSRALVLAVDAVSAGLGLEDASALVLGFAVSAGRAEPAVRRLLVLDGEWAAAVTRSSTLRLLALGAAADIGSSLSARAANWLATVMAEFMLI